MRYVTSIERRAIQQGLEKGLEQGLEQGNLEGARTSIVEVLKLRFLVVPLELIEQLQAVAELALLQSLLRAAVTAGTIEEFEQQVVDAQAEE